MIRSSVTQICRRLSQSSSNLLRKNFDQKLFESFYQRRYPSASNVEVENRLEHLLKTSSPTTFLHRCNENPTLIPTFVSASIEFDQLIDLLYFAYQRRIAVDRFVPLLMENVLQPSALPLKSFVEFLHLLVLHQQKYFHHETKRSNDVLIRFVRQLENRFDREEIRGQSISELSLLASLMYRLQMPLSNESLLEHLTEQLLDDEEKKFLSALDKQNFLKILTLSNYKRMDVAKALINRFDLSFVEQRTKLSYEIVRMMMRIGQYLSLFPYYSSSFFAHCSTLIELESRSSAPSYRAKDIIQIMNTLITVGHVHRVPNGYLRLLDRYHQTNQFDGKPERLLDVLFPLAMIDGCPPQYLEELFRPENLDRLTSRSKEKLFFIAQSQKVFHPTSKFLLDQNFVDRLPNHLFGAWSIEKKKRPYYSKTIDRLTECVPNRHYVQSSFVFRHFKIPDILLRLNKDHRPELISKTMKNSVSYVEEDDAQRSSSVTYALQVLSEEEMCFNEHFRPIGLIYSKARQLKMLNFTPVIIYPVDSLDRCETADDVFAWIRNRAETTALLLDR